MRVELLSWAQKVGDKPLRKIIVLVPAYYLYLLRTLTMQVGTLEPFPEFEINISLF